MDGWHEEGERRGWWGTNLDDRDPVEPHIEDEVAKESRDVVREEVKIQTNHTPTLEIQDNLYLEG